jgi:hypothetical protein
MSYIVVGINQSLLHQSSKPHHQAISSGASTVETGPCSLHMVIAVELCQGDETVCERIPIISH